MEGWGQMGRNMCEVPSNRIVTSIETFSQNHLHRRPSASYVMRQFTITCCGQIIANSEFAQTVMREICSGLRAAQSPGVTKLILPPNNTCSTGGRGRTASNSVSRAGNSSRDCVGQFSAWFRERLESLQISNTNGDAAQTVSRGQQGFLRSLFQSSEAPLPP